jgi:hypothetical protein
MNNKFAGGLSPTKAAIDEVRQASPAVLPESSEVSTTTAPISKWPWWGTLLIAVLLLVVLFTFQALLWGYVGSTEEKSEGEDFEQLNAIASNVQTVVMLLVGAIFGVGATQGVAAGSAKAAQENKEAADSAKATADRNAIAANTNLDRSKHFEAATKHLATAISDHKRHRTTADSRQVEDERDLLREGDSALEQPDSASALSHDPELDTMADDAEEILSRLL